MMAMYVPDREKKDAAVMHYQAYNTILKRAACRRRGVCVCVFFSCVIWSLSAADQKSTQVIHGLPERTCVSASAMPRRSVGLFTHDMYS